MLIRETLERENEEGEKRASLNTHRNTKAVMMTRLQMELVCYSTFHSVKVDDSRGKERNADKERHSPRIDDAEGINSRGSLHGMEGRTENCEAASLGWQRFGAPQK